MRDNDINNDIGKAELVVPVFERDIYRFRELRELYSDFLYVQTFEKELLELGILGFLIKVRDQ